MGQEELAHAESVAVDLAHDLRAAEAQCGGDWGDAGVAPVVVRAMDSALSRLGELNYWGPANRLASGEFWRIAEPWLRLGSLQVHARTKPRGYAGDFELLNKICDQTVCGHPLGRVFDYYFQNQAAPQAVRERTQLLAQRLVTCFESSNRQPFRVVSIGSGPARELQMAVRRIGAERRVRLHITLLDLDSQALEHAAGHLSPSLDPNGLTTIRTNLSRLPQIAAATAAISQADFLFASGFFDYLEDRNAIDMLTLFWRCLSPGGRFTVFNFAPENSSRAYMEWIGNWYLIYRDEVALRRLAEQSGIGDRCIGVQKLSQGTLVELTAERGGD